jgi:hypothetical protein
MIRASKETEGGRRKLSCVRSAQQSVDLPCSARSNNPGFFPSRSVLCVPPGLHDSPPRGYAALLSGEIS